MLLQILLYLLNYFKVQVSKYVYFTMTNTLDARTERNPEDGYDCWPDSVTNNMWSLAPERSRSQDGQTDCQFRFT